MIFHSCCECKNDLSRPKERKVKKEGRTFMQAKCKGVFPFLSATLWSAAVETRNLTIGAWPALEGRNDRMEEPQQQTCGTSKMKRSLMQPISRRYSINAGTAIDQHTCRFNVTFLCNLTQLFNFFACLRLRRLIPPPQFCMQSRCHVFFASASAVNIFFLLDPPLAQSP